MSSDGTTLGGALSGGATPGTARLRALAHPTRVQIVDLLRQHPSLTATECATMLHLTPKTCSYHLQTLAANGLVSEIAVSGRNRPWQLTSSAKTSYPHMGTDFGITATLPAGTDPTPRGADDGHRPSARRGSRADEVRVRREESLLYDAADAIAEASADPAWAASAIVHRHPATMTPEELAAWSDDVERLTRRHVRRSAGDSPGATRIPVDLTFFGAPS